jgi:hypothetical protein
MISGFSYLSILLFLTKIAIKFTNTEYSKNTYHTRVIHKMNVILCYFNRCDTLFIGR